MSRYHLVGSPRCAYETVRQDGDFASLVARYVRRLVDRGYSASTRTRYLAAVSHFLHWLKRRGHTITEIDAPLIGRYLDRHLPACDCAPWCGWTRGTPASALAQLLDLLWEGGSISLRTSPAQEALAAELAAFDRHLAEVCGLTEGTRRNYLWPVGRFLQQRVRSGSGSGGLPTPKEVRQFIRGFTVRRKPISMRSIAVPLRSYFRFKALNGANIEPLIQAIPRIVRWKLSGLPRTLTQKEIQRLLDVFDLARPKGLRDYAMLRCLTDLGLRAGEAARLQLDDIDWRAGTICIPGKGRRLQVLPLPRIVGSAIAQYLRRGRPPVQSRAVFVRARAPLNKPVKTSTVGSAVREAAARCGLPERLRGTHVLRHSFATQLVQQGTPFKLIADMLGHRSLDTTAMYAKVNLPALKRIALPWPGGQRS